MDQRPTKKRGPLLLLAKSRRFRQWLAVAMLSWIAVYFASFGPACWLTSQNGPRAGKSANRPPRFMAAYWPLGRLALSTTPIGRFTYWWMTIGVPKGKLAVVPVNLRGESIITE